MEPCYSSHASEHHDAVVASVECVRSTVGELVRLQTVVYEIALCDTRLRVVTAQSVVCSNPQLTFPVLLYRCYAVVGKAALSGKQLLGLLHQVIAVQAVVGTYPQSSAVFLYYSCRFTVVQAVLAEETGPTVSFYVETAKSHGGGDIYPFAVWG